VIISDHLQLWALERHDLIKNYGWGNDRELALLTGMSPLPKTSFELERWYEGVVANPGLKLFAIKTHQGENIGNAELAQIDWRIRRAEVGVMIGEREYWNQGYGREAVQLLAELAFMEMNLHRLEARVLSYNHRARRCFQSCGFKSEGILREAHYGLGKYHDIHLYGLLRPDYIARRGEMPLPAVIAEQIETGSSGTRKSKTDEKC